MMMMELARPRSRAAPSARRRAAAAAAMQPPPPKRPRPAAEDAALGGRADPVNLKSEREEKSQLPVEQVEQAIRVRTI